MNIKTPALLVLILTFSLLICGAVSADPATNGTINDTGTYQWHLRRTQW